MRDLIEEIFNGLPVPFSFGQILVRRRECAGFVLLHRDDASLFYPSRLAVFAAWKSGYLKTTALRETLDRQSGMYRVAAKISDPQINDLVTDFCRSDTGCLRTILWKRDRNRVIASTKLPNEKFDPVYDQGTASGPPGSATPATAAAAATVPLLCQEACNLLVAECRKVVKDEDV